MTSLALSETFFLPLNQRSFQQRGGIVTEKNPTNSNDTTTGNEQATRRPRWIVALAAAAVITILVCAGVSFVVGNYLGNVRSEQPLAQPVEAGAETVEEAVGGSGEDPAASMLAMEETGDTDGSETGRDADVAFTSPDESALHVADPQEIESEVLSQATSTPDSSSAEAADDGDASIDQPQPEDTVEQPDSIQLTATAEARATGMAQFWQTGYSLRPAVEGQPTPTPSATPTPDEPAQEAASDEPNSTGAPQVSDGMTFVSDVTVPDDMLFEPGKQFDKTWRIRNSGTAEWTTDYRLKYVSGDRLGGPDSVAVPITAVGSTADLTVAMAAPETPGNYRSVWQLVNAAEASVGGPLWMQIRVPAPDSIADAGGTSELDGISESDEAAEASDDAEPAAFDFIVTRQDVRPVIDEGGGCHWAHNIYVTVVDLHGNPLDGVLVVDTYDNLAIYSGSKGPGRCDFDLWGNTLELYIKHDASGAPATSQVTRRLSSDYPEINDMIIGGVCSSEAECRVKLDKFTYCYGHYSYDVTFQRTW
jgi:hypothetical protein